MNDAPCSSPLLPVPEPGDQLVLHHLGYARALARKIHARLPTCVAFEEIEAYALQGLVQAARRYARRNGATFETFAYRRIRGAVFDGLDQLIGVPESVRSQVHELRLRDELIGHRLGEGATDDLASALASTVRTVTAAALLEEAARDPRESTLEALEHVEANAMVRAALTLLPGPERDLLHAVHFEGRSMSDLARHHGVDKSTISRRHAAALEALTVRLAKSRSTESQRNA